MKKYPVSSLRPGMVTAKAIHSSRGQLIMEENTVLTTALISRLGFYSIYEAYVFEPKLPPVSSETQPETPTYSQQVKQRPQFQEFQQGYQIERNALQDSFTGILQNTNKVLDSDQLLTKTASLLKPTQTTIELFDMLHNMRQIDDSIYAHSLNVSLIARMMGQWLGFGEDDLSVLTLCGLLHDIGKTALPANLLEKPGKYSDEEFALVKKHPLLGYQILLDQPVDKRIKNSVLMHHERCDGSGYPRGLLQTDLDDFSMIIAIADVYDAMTAARSYRKPLCPFQVIDAFEKEGLQKYHPKYILTFLEHIANTYQHNQVMLNTSQSATIVMINKMHLTKPLVQLEDGSILDMSTRSDLEIISIL